MTVTQAQLQKYREWFREYCNSFADLTEQQILKFQLKEKHSYKVVECASEIAAALGFTEADKRIAEVIGLFHDLGRFEQIKRYDTFSDAASMDHGDFGVTVVKQFNLLDGVDKETADIILESIKYHNKFHLPDSDGTMSKRNLSFVKLIRDADKVDIFRVIMEVFTDHGDDEANTIIIGLNTEDRISDKVFADFMSDKIIHKKDVYYLNDYRVLILSWIHDINYAKTVELFVERHYFSIVAETLPDGDYKNKIMEKLQSDIKKRLARQ